jgi:hypothetical protein
LKASCKGLSTFTDEICSGNEDLSADVLHLLKGGNLTILLLTAICTPADRLADLSKAKAFVGGQGNAALPWGTLQRTMLQLATSLALDRHTQDSPELIAGDLDRTIGKGSGGTRESVRHLHIQKANDTSDPEHICSILSAYLPQVVFAAQRKEYGQTVARALAVAWQLVEVARSMTPPGFVEALAFPYVLWLTGLHNPEIWVGDSSSQFSEVITGLGPEFITPDDSRFSAFGTLFTKVLLSVPPSEDAVMEVGVQRPSLHCESTLYFQEGLQLGLFFERDWASPYDLTKPVFVQNYVALRQFDVHELARVLELRGLDPMVETTLAELRRSRETNPLGKHLVTYASDASTRKEGSTVLAEFQAALRAAPRTRAQGGSSQGPKPPHVPTFQETERQRGEGRQRALPAPAGTEAGGEEDVKMGEDAPQLPARVPPPKPPAPKLPLVLKLSEPARSSREKVFLQKLWEGLKKKFPADSAVENHEHVRNVLPSQFLEVLVKGSAEREAVFERLDALCIPEVVIRELEARLNVVQEAFQQCAPSTTLVPSTPAIPEVPPTLPAPAASTAPAVPSGQGGAGQGSPPPIIPTSGPVVTETGGEANLELHDDEVLPPGGEEGKDDDDDPLNAPGLTQEQLDEIADKLLEETAPRVGAAASVESAPLPPLAPAAPQAPQVPTGAVETILPPVGEDGL